LCFGCFGNPNGHYAGLCADTNGIPVTPTIARYAEQKANRLRTPTTCSVRRS
jgi:hypothetical protein